jgi:hypothetical protein
MTWERSNSPAVPLAPFRPSSIVGVLMLFRAS